MKRRDKWILIVVIIGCGAFGIAMIAHFGYTAVQAMRFLKWTQTRRPVLLYQTDYRALLEAGRELSRQVAAGRLEPRRYRIRQFSGDPDPETKQFPQLIMDLNPSVVHIRKDGQVDLGMSPSCPYGILVFPEDYKVSELDKVWAIKLLDGLWYYDEDFRKHPEHKKEVEELLKKRKK